MTNAFSNPDLSRHADCPCTSLTYERKEGKNQILLLLLLLLVLTSASFPSPPTPTPFFPYCYVLVCRQDQCGEGGAHLLPPAEATAWQPPPLLVVNRGKNLHVKQQRQPSPLPLVWHPVYFHHKSHTLHLTSLSPQRQRMRVLAAGDGHCCLYLSSLSPQ